MNVEAIRRLRARLRARPEHYRQDNMVAEIDLGVGEELKNIVFGTADDWPSRFHDAYYAARSDSERVEAACAFLDAIVACDGDIAAIFALGERE